jgi:hypothetical protein
MTHGERLDRSRPRRLERFIGGSPLGVAVRLLVLSFVVGLILSVLDVNPGEIVEWVRLRFEYVFSLGFEAFERAAQYLALGAVVVIPIWLISRILKTMSRRRLGRGAGRGLFGPGLGTTDVFVGESLRECAYGKAEGPPPEPCLRPGPVPASRTPAAATGKRIRAAGVFVRT